jgi:CHC2 zinc finger
MKFNCSGDGKQINLAQTLGIELDPPGAQKQSLAAAAPAILSIIEQMSDRFSALEAALAKQRPSLPKKLRAATGDSRSPWQDRIEAARGTPLEELASKYGLDRTLKHAGCELVGPCPKCGGTDRFSINPAKGVWNCRGCKKNAGDGIGLVMHLEGCGFREAVELLTPDFREAKGKDKRQKWQTTEFKFYDPETGAYRYSKIRRDPPEGSKAKKQFTFRNLESEKEERGCAPLLYGGERLADLSFGDTVFVVEGEKKVDRLAELGAAAVSTDRARADWLPEQARLLRGLGVILWPDFGEKLAAAILAECPGIEIRIIRPFGLPNCEAKGKDVCDWQGGPGELQALIDSAAPYEAPPPGELSDLPPPGKVTPIDLLRPPPRDTSRTPGGGREGDFAAAYSDDDLGLRFTLRHADDLRFTAAWDRWHRWANGLWRHDATLEYF